jgi:DNA repair protein RAD5
MVVHTLCMQVSVILLSLMAANTGLNIIEANHVLLVDGWWNPTVEDQAVDRAHHIGQTKCVKVVWFIVKDSIEVKILELQVNICHPS